MNDMTINDFIDDLSSQSPSPGGGGASALTGALACSLGLMVLNLTEGKKKFADVEELVVELLDKLSEVRDELLNDIRLDEECFIPLARAYRLPSTTDEEKKYKDEVMQGALIKACQSPIKIMQDIEKCSDILLQVEKIGTKTAYSDTGAAAALAKAAVKAASLNIYINTKSMKNDSVRLSYNAQTDDLIKRVSDKCDAIFDKVRNSYL